MATQSINLFLLHFFLPPPLSLSLSPVSLGLPLPPSIPLSSTTSFSIQQPAWVIICHEAKFKIDWSTGSLFR